MGWEGKGLRGAVWELLSSLSKNHTRKGSRAGEGSRTQTHQGVEKKVLSPEMLPWERREQAENRGFTRSQ